MRFRTAPNGPDVVQGTEQLNFAPFDAATPKTSLFRIAKGPEPGTFLLESQAKPGHFVRHDKTLAHLGKQASPFEFSPPFQGGDGMAISPLSEPDRAWRPNEKGELYHTYRAAESSVFFLEVVAGK